MISPRPLPKATGRRIFSPPPTAWKLSSCGTCHAGDPKYNFLTQLVMVPLHAIFGDAPVRLAMQVQLSRNEAWQLAIHPTITCHRSSGSRLGIGGFLLPQSKKFWLHKFHQDSRQPLAIIHRKILTQHGRLVISHEGVLHWVN
jgi:hypothetical protein